MYEKEIFSHSDAWIFLSIVNSLEDGNIDYKNLVKVADCFEMAIPNYNEVKNSFEKFIEYSILICENNIWTLSTIGKSIYSKYEKVNGGQFSRVGIAQKKLNSPRNKFEIIKNLPDITFITETEYLDICKNYSIR